MPGRWGELRKTVTLTPRHGVPLAFLITEFPGVVIQFGEGGEAAFPDCGCDACDEQPGDLIERMLQLVMAATDGRYEESLTNREFGWVLTGDWGRVASRSRLRRGAWRAEGARGVHTWPPWPER